MNSELVLSDKAGNLKIHNKNGNIHIIFMTGGMCSAYLLRDVCFYYNNSPSSQTCYIVACNLSDDRRNSIEKIVNYYNKKYAYIRFIPAKVNEDFDKINEWLPKFIRDLFNNHLFHKIRILFGFASDRMKEIITDDDVINSLIEYPFKDKYDHYRIFKRTMDFTPNIFELLTICDNASNGSICKKCDKCIEIKNYLTMCSMTYPKEIVVDRCKDAYESLFGEQLITDGKAIITNPSTGNIELIDTTLIGFDINNAKTNKMIYVSRDRTKEE